MAKRNLLNVRSHLEHCQIIFEGLQQYGWCPAIQDEVRKAKLFNEAILRKHKEKGTRKDIYVER